MTNPAVSRLKIMLQEAASGQTSIGDILAALDDSLGKQLASPVCAYCGGHAHDAMLQMGSNLAHLPCVHAAIHRLIYPDA